MEDEAEDAHVGIDETRHANLLSKFFDLNKRTLLKKPSRTEPTLAITEFSLTKSGTGERGKVHIKDLKDAFKKRVKHVPINEKLINTNNKSKILPKPLHLVQVQQLRRISSYDNVKINLDRWNSVVTANRASNCLRFPLIEKNDSEEEQKIGEYRIKSDLFNALENLEHNVQQGKKKVESNYPLTMTEILERRKQIAKIRAIQSYRETKAYRQKKIKSKKYHSILRHNRVKQQIKEFQLLQEKDPECALRKLEEFEYSRAKERATLKHRNTSKWAKSNQIRAKYDKNSRQLLTQQLLLSRHLTEPIKKLEIESDDESTEQQLVQTDKDNLWFRSHEVAQFENNYQKFKKVHEKNVPSSSTFYAKKTLQIKDTEEISLKETSKLKKMNECKNKFLGTSKWDVSVCAANNISEISVNADECQVKLRKQNKLTKNLQLEKRKTTKQYNVDLSFPKKSKRPIMDEPLSSESLDKTDSFLIFNNTTLKQGNTCKNTSLLNLEYEVEKKTVNLETTIPSIFTLCENGQQATDRGTISEAFEDDEIVKEFDKNKNDILKNKSVNINVTLPGWGSWGGSGLKPSKQKRKFNITKNSKHRKSTEMDKKYQVINKKAIKSAKNHLVSDIPFPFKTVADFEASIRTPLGNTFIPETAYRRIINPAIKTKIGTIIQPMSDDILLKTK